MTPSDQQRIAILGCGYVGSAVGRKLAALGHDVLATTTTPSRMGEINKAGMTAHQLELKDVAKLRSLLADRDAVLLTYGAGQRGDYEGVYIQGARSMVEAVSGSAVRRIIYTSSTRVYGQDDGAWVDENSPTNTSDEKGQALVEAERILLDGIPEAQPHPAAVSVLRLGGIHGPQRELSPRILTQPGLVRDDGQAYINLIHLDDIVSAMTKLLEINFHGLLNVTNDDPQTRRQLYDTVLASAEMKPIQWTDRDQPTRGKRVCNKRIKQLLQISL